MNPTVITAEVPLHILLHLLAPPKELSLFSPNSPKRSTSGGNHRPMGVCFRRMELSKIPRIAAALQIDARELCAKALAEFHLLVYATLFGDDTVRAQIQPPPV